MLPEKYLGDGLYASFDGFQIRLRAPREHGDDMVFLDGETLSAFEKYIEEIKKQPDPDQGVPKYED